jgi:hypothetical protein
MSNHVFDTMSFAAILYVSYRVASFATNYLTPL